ncbi:MAG: acetoin dehydrogenase dihydrolipoyllysine-residue acetyltransferase subunit [Alphaproteobacteria bacterium]|nr:acetoin dehydrogenase dihydrolipoyllysine-residue acetyltransferase subunit [Alphaproteobacteria bacterium]
MAGHELTAVTMPKWGMSMTTGQVVGWLEEDGARVEKGAEIVEIETEKTVNVLEAVESGILVRTIAQAGDKLPVGALLGVIAQNSPGNEAIEAFIEKFQQDFTTRDNNDASDNQPLDITLADNITIAYQYLPAGQDGDNLPIILLHGFGGDRNSWLFNSAELNSGVYALDLPGHGGSSKKVGDGSLAFLAHIVSEFMTALDLPKAHIVGHSLGASVALSLAHSFPAKVAALTLLSGLGTGTEVNRQYIEGFLAANRRKTLKPWMQQLFFNADMVSRDMVEEVLKAKRIEGAEACLGKIAAAAVLAPAEPNPAPDLAQLTMPLQVIWGRQDRIAPPDQTRDLPDGITVTIIEKAGHMVHMEAAKRVNKLIRDFSARTGS